ncbi:hypothetical protein D3C79_842110 [compost metagenome]
MPGFRCGKRQPDRLRVAQLAEHDHIRILTQPGAQGLGKAMAMPADFTLADQAALWRMDKLDGVFKGEDMQLPLPVQVIKQSGQGGGLAGTGRAGDQHQPRR